MLSILIPVFNFDVTELVNELLLQCNDQKVPFEIRVYDDHSTNTHLLASNNKLESLPSVVYKKLPENLGRSAIRNLLANEAKYTSLLFLDCDSAIQQKSFIGEYINHLNKADVIYGGRDYEKNPPADHKKYFRWFYGINREQINAQQRAKKPYHSFMTNNFLIKKEVYQSIQLDESIKGYGHEDTLFGIELEKKEISITHIDNPLTHIGLEDVTEFLEKTKQGLKNLFIINRKHDLTQKVKLLKYHNILANTGMQQTFLNWFLKKESSLVSNLLSDKPSLGKFDIFKLGLYCQIITENK
jgi:hypothetical protein